MEPEIAFSSFAGACPPSCSAIVSHRRTEDGTAGKSFQSIDYFSARSLSPIRGVNIADAMEGLGNKQT